MHAHTPGQGNNLLWVESNDNKNKKINEKTESINATEAYRFQLHNHPGRWCLYLEPRQHNLFNIKKNKKNTKRQLPELHMQK